MKVSCVSHISLFCTVRNTEWCLKCSVFEMNNVKWLKIRPFHSYNLKGPFRKGDSVHLAMYNMKINS